MIDIDSVDHDRIVILNMCDQLIRFRFFLLNMRLTIRYAV